MTLQNTWFYYITPDGDSVLINDHTWIFFCEEEGFGLFGGEMITERTAFDHGTKHIGYYLPMRDVLIRIGIKGTDDADWRARDDHLCRLCSPFIDEAELGTLRRVYIDGTTRDIDCLMTEYSKASKDKQGPVYGERLLKFTCPDPFFYDPEYEEVNYNLNTEGGFTYPMSFPFSYAETNINEHTTVWNGGDVKCYPLIYAYGPLRNPTIENETTGYTISISQELEVNDVIQIDMNECTVEFWDDSEETLTSITETMTTTSTFWSLRRGANSIHFTALDVENGGVIFRFNNRYQSA